MLCQFEFGVPRFKGARMIQNIKILEFLSGAYFGSFIVWATKIPGGWNSNMLCRRGPCIAYYSSGFLGLRGPR